MNEKQKTYLEQFIKNNSFEGDKESEWTPPTCVNVVTLKDLIEGILELDN